MPLRKAPKRRTYAEVSARDKLMGSKLKVKKAAEAVTSNLVRSRRFSDGLDAKLEAATFLPWKKPFLSRA